MTTPPTSQTNPLDPVFSGVPVVIPQGDLVSPTWNKWFVDLREKVNVINSTLAAWSGITPVTGLTPGTYGDVTHYPIVTVNEFGLVTAITVQTVSGGGGSPVYVNNVSATYTILASDIPAASSYRGLISITSASANSVSIDTFANISRPIGSELTVFQRGTGTTTIKGVAGVTLVGPTIAGGGQYSSGKAIEIASDLWVISGNLAWISGPPTGFASYALSLSPVAYWRMQETSGTTLTDSIGGQVATLSGAYTLGQSGLVTGGSSVLFSGGMANTSASSVWALGTGDFSAFGIFKYTSDGVTAAIRDSSANVLFLAQAGAFVTSGHMGFSWWVGSGQIIDTGVSINTGTPQSWAISYDVATNQFFLYVNGSLTNTVTASSAARPTGSTMSVRIANNFSTAPFHGDCGDLLLFNKALTSTEIATLASYVL